MLPDGSQGMAPGIRTELLADRAPTKAKSRGAASGALTKTTRPLKGRPRMIADAMPRMCAGHGVPCPYEEQADGGRGRKTSGRPDRRGRDDLSNIEARRALR